MNDIIARIKHKLAYLQQNDDGDVTNATHDRQWQIQNAYPYKLQPPHTESEIATFEARHRIRLPEDYRQFLLHVGRCGTGPFYSLFSPISQMASPREVEALKGNPNLSEDDFLKLEAMPLLRLNRRFPFIEETADVYEFLVQHKMEEDEQYKGQIMLSEFGCGIWHSLIITGKCRGQMWYIGNDEVTPIFVASPAEHNHFILNHADEPLFDAETRVTFTQWYEAWLNKQILIAQEHWQKRGRDIPPLTLE